MKSMKKAVAKKNPKQTKKTNPVMSAAGAKGAMKKKLMGMMKGRK